MAAYRRKRDRSASGDAAPGDDSFLDIVANIVGILIILVMVVGVRVGSAPHDSASSALATAQSHAEAEHRLAQLVNERDAARRQLAGATATASTLARKHEDALAAAERLRAQLSAAEAEVAEPDPEIARLEVELAERRGTADSLGDELERLRKTEHPPTKLICYPTPVAREVEGGEAHFQLKGGRVAVVELDRLLAQFKSDAQTQARKLRMLSDVTSTVGPVAGFRLRYHLERFETPYDVSIVTGNRETGVRLTEWELIPVASDLGETVEEAFGPRALFAAKVAQLNPAQTVVTLWTYPDSFELFRQLRAWFYEQGFSVAARPLPDGERIAGSPSGSRSVAQ
ncbi:MAG: hypothetical protein KDA63_01390 [Planctomycetales bacterium]|nr:hypothetical protein [Planctomycetales bacterium]